MSLRLVSSNPGVSINVTVCPSRSNGLDVWMSAVQLSSPLPTTRSDPLARLMNCETLASIYHQVLCGPAYHRFATSSSSHDSVDAQSKGRSFIAGLMDVRNPDLFSLKVHTDSGLFSRQTNSGLDGGKYYY